jgi:hypothetical protein
MSNFVKQDFLAKVHKLRKVLKKKISMAYRKIFNRTFPGFAEAEGLSVLFRKYPVPLSL